MSNSPGFSAVEVPVPEEVQLGVRDETVAYGYSNLFRVRLRVRLQLPGHEAAHERVLEKMGVYAEQLEASKQELLDGFLHQIKPYLERPGFAPRLAEHLHRQREQAHSTTGYV